MGGISTMLMGLLCQETKTGALRLGPEEQECLIFANELRQLSIEGRLRAVWTHVPNEIGGSSKDKRSRNLAGIRYTIAKSMGMVPGAADYMFLACDGSYCLEMKSASGKQQPNQKKFQKWCEHCDVPYALAYSAREAIEQLRAWNLISR